VQPFGHNVFSSDVEIEAAELNVGDGDGQPAQKKSRHQQSQKELLRETVMAGLTQYQKQKPALKRKITSLSLQDRHGPLTSLKTVILSDYPGTVMYLN